MNDILTVPTQHSIKPEPSFHDACAVTLLVYALLVDTILERFVACVMTTDHYCHVIMTNDTTALTRSHTHTHEHIGLPRTAPHHTTPHHITPHHTTPHTYLQLLFLYPVYSPFLPILRQPAGTAQFSPFSTKNISHMCLEGSVIPMRCLQCKMISPFTHQKMEGLTPKLLHSVKAIFVTRCTLFHRF